MTTARKALARARAAEAELQKAAPTISPREGPRAVAQANNSSGLIGIRPRYVQFCEHPYLYFVASSSGKPRSTSFSAERHGKLVALQMAMERRERATGMSYEMTARQAPNRMKHLPSAR